MSEQRTSLVSVGERVRVQTIKNDDDRVLYWFGTISFIDDHGIRLTRVTYGPFEGAITRELNVCDSDVVLTWKAISRISVTPS